MTNFEIKELPSSEVELSGELPAADFAKFRGQAIAHLNEHVSVPGFREGKAPEAVLEKHVGSERILMEMAELALQDLYPKIIDEKKIDAIGRPEITITKLAADNPLGWKIKTAVAPVLTLPDYQTLAKTANAQPLAAVEISEEELNKLLEEIRQSRVNPETKVVPELNDDLAKSVGNFQTLAELKNRLRENLKQEKEAKARDKRRLEIMEAIIGQSTIPLPPVLIEGELDRMLAELQSDVERLGLKLDDYLKHLQKTAEELRLTWRPDAEKRLKTSLILDKIASEQKLAPKPEAVEAEAKHLLAHYPNVSPERIATHVQALLRNEEVWQFLENQK